MKKRHTYIVLGIGLAIVGLGFWVAAADNLIFFFVGMGLSVLGLCLFISAMDLLDHDEALEYLKKLEEEDEL